MQVDLQLQLKIFNEQRAFEEQLPWVPIQFYITQRERLVFVFQQDALDGDARSAAAKIIKLNRLEATFKHCFQTKLLKKAAAQCKQQQHQKPDGRE